MSTRMRSTFGLTALVLTAACGSSQSQEGTPASAQQKEISCPSPIGIIQSEDCESAARDFEAFSVEGALKHTGSDAHKARRDEAIKAVDSLVKALKSERARLCQEYNACKVPQKDHAARDRVLADIMTQLVKLWDSRKFNDPATVDKFYDDVIALHRSLDPNAGTSKAAAPGTVPPKAEPSTIVEGDKLARIDASSLSFGGEAGAAKVTSKDEGARDAFRGPADKIRLEGGKRWLIKLNGSYAPASPSLLSTGDEAVIRLKYKAESAVELYVAMRTVEDPESEETMLKWKAAAGEKGSKETTLTAPPGASGPYIAVGALGSGNVEFDDIEVVKGGSVIAAARAETAGEAFVKSNCTEKTKGALSGKKSFQCGAGPGDRLTLGMPTGHLFVSIRSPAGERASLKTVSLEGGRSLDANLAEGAELIIGLFGPGTATIRSVEIRSLAK